MPAIMSSPEQESLDPVLADLRRDVDAGRVQPFEAYASRVAAEDRERLREEYGVAVGLWAAGDSGAERGRSPSAAHTQDRDRIGPCRLLREIGRGGQGVVHLARDERLHREVAVKVLHDSVALEDESFLRFRREAEAASRLDHPGVCAIHDFGVVGRMAYIVMRYVEGESLDRRIAASREGTALDEPSEFALGASPETEGGPRARPTPKRQAALGTDPSAPHPHAPTSRAAIHAILRLVSSSARTLHAAHKAGIVHRDVKPGNLVVTPADEVVVMDFGLSHLDDTDLPAVTRTGAFFGTPAYMSPEQLLA
jgi:serine/threonine protein kinase